MAVSLARLVKRGLSVGEPLPDVYQSFQRKDIRLWRSSVTLVGGVPGSMKTMLILNLVDEMKVPTLYISNDSNEATIASRLLARRLGRDANRLREELQKTPERFSEALRDLDWIRWSFSAAPSIGDIQEELEAFGELYGDYPKCVVVDVLKKVDYMEESEHATDEGIVRHLDHMARESGAAFVVAAHTSENVDGYPCQPMKAFLNKISKFPVLCMTTAYQDGTFYVAPVKNRDGFADASGRSSISFNANPGLARLEEWE